MDLRYFKMTEFGTWAGRMDPALLVYLDWFRDSWGKPVLISPAPGAIGRPSAKPGERHYATLDASGPRARAVDIMLPIPAGTKGRYRKPTVSELEGAYDLACYIFHAGGVGVYPDWNPYPGLHLDVVKPGRWGALNKDGKQIYVASDVALDHALHTLGPMVV